MDVRAVVAFQPGKPRGIETVQFAGAREGRCRSKSSQSGTSRFWFRRKVAAARGDSGTLVTVMTPCCHRARSR